MMMIARLLVADAREPRVAFAEEAAGSGCSGSGVPVMMILVMVVVVVLLVRPVEAQSATEIRERWLAGPPQFAARN